VTTDWIERAAIGASLLCLVHCIGLPLIVAALPALSRMIPLPDSVHLWILGFAAPTSALALGAGYWRHGSIGPMAFGAAGLALLAVGAIVLGGGAFETPVTVAGSLFLASGHIANWRLRHRGHRHG
jgi:hypothetical protein